MKWLLSRLYRTVGAAMLLGLSAGAYAQSVSCTSTTCSYGPICPDAWGGCYFYTWAIGSFKTTWTETSQDISKYVSGPCNKDPSQCVQVTSGIQQIVDDRKAYNAVIFCQAPGSQTCTGNQCGGSLDSSGGSFANFVNLPFFEQQTGGVSCTKDNKTGLLTCTKNTTVTGPENTPENSAKYCVNPSWTIRGWWPVDFTGLLKVTVPTSSSDSTPITKIDKNFKCQLADPQGHLPGDNNYKLSIILTDNSLSCGPVQ